MKYRCLSVVIAALFSGAVSIRADANGTRSPVWYEARRVFREVRNFGDLYCTYRNLGAFTVNCTEKTPYPSSTAEKACSSHCREFFFADIDGR